MCHLERLEIRKHSLVLCHVALPEAAGEVRTRAVLGVADDRLLGRSVLFASILKEEEEGDMRDPSTFDRSFIPLESRWRSGALAEGRHVKAMHDTHPADHLGRFED